MHFKVWKSKVEEGSVQLRPGILRLIDEAISSGIKIGVVSNSNFNMVNAVVTSLLGGNRASKISIFSSDIPIPKKPNPDLYLYAAKTLGVAVENCLVVEDSEVGLRAALDANMKAIVTLSTFSRDENFEGAKLVVESLDQLPGDLPVSILLLEKIINA